MEEDEGAGVFGFDAGLLEGGLGFRGFGARVEDDALGFCPNDFGDKGGEAVGSEVEGEGVDGFGDV